MSLTNGSTIKKILIKYDKKVLKKIKCNSRGLGSVNNEHIDNKTLEIVKAGDQLFLRISRQIRPVQSILQ